jgi:16S rRNA (guanine527-N7)-methyltransferase
MPVSRETYDWKLCWRDKLRILLRDLSTPQIESAAEKLERFAELILKKNEILHLVSQRSPEREVVKQIIDSASVGSILSLLPGCRLLDVGSGAGFPGIVLKVLFPATSLISLDSAPRKIAFQREASSMLGIEAEFIAEDFRQVELAMRADIVIAKALGSHDVVIRRSRRWLRPGGWLVIFQGRDIDSKIMSSAHRYPEFSEVYGMPYSLPEFDTTLHLAMICKK